MTDEPDVIECKGPAGAGPASGPPPRRVRVAGADDVAEGTAEQVEVEGTKIALVRIGDQYRAVGDRCTHANYSLSEGELDPEDCTIECWKHGALFSLTSGEALTLPATRPVAVYDVEVSDGEVYVMLPIQEDDS